MSPAATIRHVFAPLSGVRRSGRMLKVALTLFYLALAAPMTGLVMLALSGKTGLIQLAWTRGLSDSFRDTTLLLAGVGLLSATIGVGTAWLIAMNRFPGRTILGALLVLPLALPTYLAAYIAVELGDFYGPAQSTYRWLFNYTSRRDYEFPEVRSLTGAVLVFSLVLYPYIYLPARLMFEKQGSSIIQAARLHGAKGFRLFFRIGLPLARPAIVGGVVFALLETLNDIGAVEHLGVQSLSLTIRSIWLNRGDLPGAAQLALIGLMLVTAILALEFMARRQSSYAGPTRATPPVIPAQISGFKAFAAGLACATPVILGFGLPAIFLGIEALRMILKSGPPADLLRTLLNSVGLSVTAGIIVAAIGGIVALAARLLRGPAAAFAPRAAMLGYAIPGTVLVIALLPVFAVVDDGFERLGMPIVLSGSVVAILLAYLVRFTGIGVTQAETALSRISQNVDHAARTLGRDRTQIALTVLAPNLVRALGIAGLFAFVDAMKELPATLLLRPLNMETLATSIYAKASGGAFEDGAIEALLLLLIGLLPVLLLNRQRRG